MRMVVLNSKNLLSRFRRQGERFTRSVRRVLDCTTRPATASYCFAKNHLVGHARDLHSVPYTLRLLTFQSTPRRLNGGFVASIRRSCLCDVHV